MYQDLMNNKTVLYVHGFGSSGQSGTVRLIESMLPKARVIAPDLPITPEEAMQLLENVCQTEKPDLIIATSMGAMFSEMLYGYWRILVNPAFQMGDTMTSHNMVGKNTFSAPRKDGVQEFLITKQHVRLYRDMTMRCFHRACEEDKRKVFGLFGDKDTVVDTRHIFQEHYPQDISFHGEHRLQDKVFLHSIMPVIRWIDDEQENRERPKITIHINALRNAHNEPFPSAIKALNTLLPLYDIHFLCPAPAYDSDYYRTTLDWLNDHINVPAYGHTIFQNRADMLLSDYLIEQETNPVTGDFMGTKVAFQSDKMKTWDEIITYFSLLGGQ